MLSQSLQKLARRAVAPTRRNFQKGALPAWATVDPWAMSGAAPAKGRNFVDGEWRDAAHTKTIPDPLNGEAFLEVPDAQGADLDPFVDAMRRTPKSGLHNPLKAPEKYFELGECNALIGAALRDEATQNFFAELLQRVVPKHDKQVLGEVTTVRKWVEGFAGDGVRRLAQATSLPGDHAGQETRSYRWPYGATSVITPFNFPLEIPALQSLASVWMGNKCTVKIDERVQIVYEQFLRLCHACGFPKDALDLIYCSGPAFNDVLIRGDAKMTLFTGSQAVAEKLTLDLRGKVKLEDAGFDWKILGPDVPAGGREVDFVAHQCDQDAYAFSGQKCSAQSILFCHENWIAGGAGRPGPDILAKLKARAEKRGLGNLTAGPALTLTTGEILGHVERLLQLRGARLLWGGRELEEGAHQIPPQYGAVEPTAVFLPLETLLADPETFALATREIFGPFQVVTQFSDAELPRVLEAVERMEAQLTAAVVSNDALFVQRVLAHSVNGTTYAGLRARTTGAPQNHWFGPAGDPRAAGIGTREAIQVTWSGHREIVTDEGPVPEGPLVQS